MPRSPTLTTLSLRVASKAQDGRLILRQIPRSISPHLLPGASTLPELVHDVDRAGGTKSRRLNTIQTLPAATESQRKAASSSVNLGLGKLAPPVTARNRRAMVRVNQNCQVTFCEALQSNARFLLCPHQNQLPVWNTYPVSGCRCQPKFLTSRDWALDEPFKARSYKIHSSKDQTGWLPQVESKFHSAH